jgi:hypothetical protein
VDDRLRTQTARVTNGSTLGGADLTGSTGRRSSVRVVQLEDNVGRCGAGLRERFAMKRGRS